MATVTGHTFTQNALRCSNAPVRTMIDYLHGHQRYPRCSCADQCYTKDMMVFHAAKQLTQAQNTSFDLYAPTPACGLTSTATHLPAQCVLAGMVALLLLLGPQARCLLTSVCTPSAPSPPEMLHPLPTTPVCPSAPSNKHCTHPRLPSVHPSPPPPPAFRPSAWQWV